MTEHELQQEGYKATMYLRWRETDEYDPLYDRFCQVLEQKYINNEGDVEWREIEVYEIN